MPLIFLADFFLEIFVRFIIKIRPVDVKDFSVINAKFLHSIKSVCFMFRQFTATHSIVIAVVYLNQAIWGLSFVIWAFIAYVQSNSSELSPMCLSKEQSSTRQKQ